MTLYSLIRFKVSFPMELKMCQVQILEVLFTVSTQGLLVITLNPNTSGYQAKQTTALQWQRVNLEEVTCLFSLVIGLSRFQNIKNYELEVFLGHSFLKHIIANRKKLDCTQLLLIIFIMSYNLMTSLYRILCYCAQYFLWQINNWKIYLFTKLLCTVFDQ